jgi:hypothetical protein
MANAFELHKKHHSLGLTPAPQWYLYMQHMQSNSFEQVGVCKCDKTKLPNISEGTDMHV